MKTGRGYVVLLAVLCVLTSLARPARAVTLLDEEMSLLQGGGGNLCGYPNEDKPCTNTVQDVSLLEVGQGCWICLNGESLQISCKRPDPPQWSLRCKAHSVSNWCGNKYPSIVVSDPHTHEKHCMVDDSGIIQGGCPGSGDPIDGCPEEEE